MMYDDLQFALLLQIKLYYINENGIANVTPCRTRLCIQTATFGTHPNTHGSHIRAQGAHRIHMEYKDNSLLEPHTHAHVTHIYLPTSPSIWAGHSHWRHSRRHMQ